MTHEEVMDWIITAMSWCLHLMLLCTMILVVGFGAGYATEKYAQKDPRCLNSACEQQCKPNARFVRHQGCVK